DRAALRAAGVLHGAAAEFGDEPWVGGRAETDIVEVDRSHGHAIAIARVEPELEAALVDVTHAKVDLAAPLVPRPGASAQRQGAGAAGVAGADTIGAGMDLRPVVQGLVSMGGPVVVHGVRLQPRAVRPEDGRGVVLEARPPVLAAVDRFG